MPLKEGPNDTLPAAAPPPLEVKRGERVPPTSVAVAAPTKDLLPVVVVVGERETQEVKDAAAKEGVDRRVVAGVCVEEASDPQGEGVGRGEEDKVLPLLVAA